MNKEHEPRTNKEKLSNITKKVLKWAVIVGGVAVGLQFIINLF